MRSPYQAYKSPFGPQYVDLFLFRDTGEDWDWGRKNMQSRQMRHGELHKGEEDDELQR